MPIISLRNKKEELKDRQTILSLFNELDQPFSEDEVKHSIKMLQNKKTAGLDRIRSEMLKNGTPYLTTSLTELFYFLLGKGTYPGNWSTGIICPIFNQGINPILQITETFVSLVVYVNYSLLS